MVDKDPYLRRIVIDLPRSEVPTMLSYLADFALGHDIALDIGDAPAGITMPAIHQEEVPGYNEAMVTLLPDKSSDVQVPVVTEQNLADFDRASSQAKGRASRVIRYLGVGVNTGSDIEEMLYGEWFTSGEARRFVASGIRVEHIRRLAHLLETKSLVFRKIGEASISLLKRYSEELFKN